MMAHSIDYIIEKSLQGEELNKEEIAALFAVETFSVNSFKIQLASRKKSILASNGKAEVHAQVGLNVSPCPKNCEFCSFAAKNKIFDKHIEHSLAAVTQSCLQFEEDGANAIYLMITANFPFERFLEIAGEVRKKLKPETVMIANVPDFNKEQAKKLKDSGFTGVYHALRIGEGKVTAISPHDRKKTFEAAREAGLVVGTCVEPVGPEHSIEELVEATIITREIKPAYSGSARRIPIPSTEMAKLGKVTEARMAHILAVVRLAMGYDIPGNCTHEPNVIGAAFGANLFWAEVGSNPRDVDENTEKGRGMSVKQCRELFLEAEWETRIGPSKWWNLR